MNKKNEMNTESHCSDQHCGHDHAAEHAPNSPYVNPQKNIGRNDSCPCGSGKKFKKCCIE